MEEGKDINMPVSKGVEGENPTGGAFVQPNNKKSSKGLVALIATIVVLLGTTAGIAIYVNSQEKDPSYPEPYKPDKPVSYDSTSNEFSVKFLQNVATATGSGSNMLISPYSMEAVWQIAGKGAAGNTKTQIYDMLGSERTMPTISGLHSANAAFIRETIADKIKNEFLDSVNGDIIYDSFETPSAMNAWVNDNTNGMIPVLFNQAPEGEMVLANAIAMEKDWDSEFECDSTRGVDFTKTSGETVEASMMNGEANYYFSTDNAEGVIRNYKAENDGNYLEFVAFRPKDSVQDYLKNSFESDLSSFDSNLIAPSRSDEKVVTVSVSLPRFSYSYEAPDLVNMFKNSMGVSDAFDAEKADFSGISDEMNFYVSNLIQKTFVEMSETGTRAAAVTAMTLNTATAYQEEPEHINYHVDLNKPFIYMIRDHATKEIIFEGIVEEPELFENYDDCKDSEE